MPRYDYNCTSCVLEIEITHGFDAPTPGCPECSEPMSKRYQPTPAVFNGPGFYTTDRHKR
jgi:putative FmdB family regulatory protein